MISENQKIIVQVDYNQKQSTKIGDTNLLLAKDFSKNFRERNPVLCQVVEDNDHVPIGTILLVHHNRFVKHSPHHLGDNFYSIAYNSSIFAWVDETGEAHQMCGNIIVERIIDNDNPLTPPNLKVVNDHKYIVVVDGEWYKKGQIIFCYPQADYEVIYQFNGKERRIVKVIKEDIVGFKK